MTGRNVPEFHYNKNCESCGTKLGEVGRRDPDTGAWIDDKREMERGDARLRDGWGHFCGAECRDKHLDSSLHLEGEHVSVQEFVALVGDELLALEIVRVSIVHELMSDYFARYVPHFIDIPGEVLAVRAGDDIRKSVRSAFARRKAREYEEQLPEIAKRLRGREPSDWTVSEIREWASESSLHGRGSDQYLSVIARLLGIVDAGPARSDAPETKKRTGVAIIAPNATGRTGWRMRYLDPHELSKGNRKFRFETFPEHITTSEQREEYARLKSEELLRRRIELQKASERVVRGDAFEFVNSRH